VLVHTGAKAAESARAVNALAYTVGRHIVFGAGQYAPGITAEKNVLAHELTHVVQQAQVVDGSSPRISSPGDQHEQEADRAMHTVGSERSDRGRPISPDISTLPGPSVLQRLGANPGCSAAEARAIHQAIFDARGWLNKAIPKLEESPLSASVLASLRRNFGPTYGVAANAPLIRDRLRVARAALGRIPFSCDAGVDPLCVAQHCGWSVPGSNAAAICTSAPSTLTFSAAFQAGCVLHESIHAAMSFMVVDHYTDSPGYPGPGTDPLLNPESYTTLTKDLS